MKRSSLMHGAMILSGTAGFLALLGAWFAGEGGTFMGFSEQHLFWDALNLQTIAISAGVCTLVYIKRDQ